MKHHPFIAAAGIFLLATPALQAETKVTVGHNVGDDASAAFVFNGVPRPSAGDAARSAKFSVVAGTEDSNSGGVEKLNDGGLPNDADQPGDNFFFDAGTDGGRLQVDLGTNLNIRQVNTYSWHPGSRGPQVYKLYVADGAADDFNARPKAGTSPEQCGWKLIASVDTRPKSEDAGGQYGVSVASSEGNLGQYRYLLFDISATEQDDQFGNTFYSEIDVIDASAPVVQDVATVPEAYTFKTTDGNCTITLDTSKAPGLENWATNQLAPVLAAWYPKITALLPSPGYDAPTHFKITIKPMSGVAYTAGRNVTASSTWLEGELKGEAIGSLVHELVHVVQQFHSRSNPGWLVEGSADYIRWFLYDADMHGADMVWMRKHGKNFSPHYNDSYRVTANFLNWVSEKYDKDIVPQMNAAMREGKYNEDLWKQYTGKPLAELAEEWQKEVTAQLAGRETSTKPN